MSGCGGRKAVISGGSRLILKEPQGLEQAPENAPLGKKDTPQGLKPDLFSIVMARLKVVP
jgi:hypothetical protein